MEAIQRAPKWMKKLWNKSVWSPLELEKIITGIELNNLRCFGDGSVREQWGAYGWCFTEKGDTTKFSIRSGPVHGNRNHMKAIRSEADYVLSGASLLFSLQNFVTNKNSTVEIHTDCQG